MCEGRGEGGGVKRRAGERGRSLGVFDGDAHLRTAQAGPVQSRGQS